MRTGLDLLLTDLKALVAGKAVGLVVNQTAVDANLVHAIDRFLADPDLNPVRLFGPEHGVRGDAQDMITVEDQRDARSGLPVVSLYGQEEGSLRPTPASLQDLQVLVFDIQDIGSRYYTFIYTMAYCMEAAGQAGIPIVVCDRPNPITGTPREGNVLDMAFRSFVGRYPLPIRHGMTAGELALFFREHCGVLCDLKVVPMEGWSRDQWFDQTGLPWVQPSPNMPTVDTALVYPGMCLIEGTNVSEGRGTTRPFHLIGAPWIDGHALADALNTLALPGVRWRPTAFTPMFQKFQRQQCGGVELHVIDRNHFKPVLSGVALLQALHRLYPDDFRWRTERYEYVSDTLAIDLLGGGQVLRQQVEAQVPLAVIEAFWESELRGFRHLSDHCLLY